MKIRLFPFFAVLFFLSCISENPQNPAQQNFSGDYRTEMRNFVITISETARQTDPDFIIIPQNGIELICMGETSDTELATDYLAAIDGHGQEDMFYGYEQDDVATPADVTAYLRSYLDRSKANGKTILAADYCWTTSKMDDSYAKNFDAGYISFSAMDRSMDEIPSYPKTPYKENTDPINTLADAKNFLYLINPPDQYATSDAFVEALDATTYDIILIDLFFHDGSALTLNQITDLKTKPDGAKRLVIAYMSIGEAEEYRYYWQASWNTGSPSFLAKEDPNWEGNYYVRYWDPQWQQIIATGTNSYLSRLLTAGFDGVYLDIIDAFEYFEAN